MKHETAGDPMTGLKWTRKTTEKIAQELACLGIQVSPNTVARVLKDMGFSLRANHKTLASGNKKPPDPRDRDMQFGYIRQLREAFAKDGNPTISVDTKKKELIGNFKNPGRTWGRAPIAVKDHDFRSDALGIAVPYGIYDPERNAGALFVGRSCDTPAFAVDAIEGWWTQQGRKHYPHAKELLVLADSGGSNGLRSRVWKHRIQRRLCDPHKLTVTVCHYPPGASKWNPVEHRLFSEITKNWAGRPLDSFAKVTRYARTTRTATGLRVSARLIRKKYKKGEKVADKEMARLSLTRHQTLPDWNYTLAPSQM